MSLAISESILLPVALVIICSLAAITLLVFYIVRRRKTRLKSSLSEIDILNALKDSKVFPVEYSNGWKLYDYVNGQQLWSHDLHMPSSSSPPPAEQQKQQKQKEEDRVDRVFGCFSKVKGSPQMVLNILKDSQKHDHWTISPRPLLRTDSLPSDAASAASAASRSPSLTGGGRGQGSAPSVCHDVICIQTSSDDTSSSSSSLSRLQGRLCSWLIPVRFRKNSVQVATIQRFWQREENGCCWLLEYDSDAEEWTFRLMQPIEGWFETDRCMLTFLFSFGRTQKRQTMRIHCERMAIKLCSVRDYLQNRRIQTIPLVRLSLTYPEGETTPLEGNSSSSGGAVGLVLTSPSDGSKSKETRAVTRDASQDVSLLQKFKNMIELKRESYEVEKRRKAARATSTDPSSRADGQGMGAVSSIQSPFDLLRKLSPSKSLDLGRGGGGGGGRVDGGEGKRIADQTKEPTPPVRKEISENGGGREEEEQRTSNATKGTLLRRRMPLLNEIGRSRSVMSSSEIYKVPEVSEKAEETDLDGKKSSPSEETPENATTQSPASVAQTNKENELEGSLKLIAETTIGNLIAEKGRVSQLNITSSYKEQAKTTGGWTYRGLEKDTVLLQKEVDDDNPVHSYLGKGMVPAPPRLVYEILRKPLSRKSYDVCVQKVQVLHEFESGMKIVYMNYEGMESSKKKCHDLCLLQSEKCEGKRYIISLQSVDWPKCKELENVARVKMTASGWIIEPVVKGKDVFSMITYITQMELGSNQGSSDYLDEFAAKQPSCIIALRQYMATTRSDHPTTDCSQPLHSLGRNSSLSAAS